MTKQRQFTLVELLAAMAIIAVLTALIVGAAGYASRAASEAKTKSRLEQMRIALEACRQDRGVYPQSPLDGSGNPIPHQLSFNTPWRNSQTNRPYLEGYDSGDYLDAWGRPFWYQCPGTMNPETYDLWSMGRDGAHGNYSGSQGNPTDAQTHAARDSDDITNWK